MRGLVGTAQVEVGAGQQVAFNQDRGAGEPGDGVVAGQVEGAHSEQVEGQGFERKAHDGAFPVLSQRALDDHDAVEADDHDVEREDLEDRLGDALALGGQAGRQQGHDPGGGGEDREGQGGVKGHRVGSEALHGAAGFGGAAQAREQAEAQDLLGRLGELHDFLGQVVVGHLGHADGTDEDAVGVDIKHAGEVSDKKGPAFAQVAGDLAGARSLDSAQPAKQHHGGHHGHGAGRHRVGHGDEPSVFGQDHPGEQERGSEQFRRDVEAGRGGDVFDALKEPDREERLINHHVKRENEDKEVVVGEGPQGQHAQVDGDDDSEQKELHPPQLAGLAAQQGGVVLATADQAGAVNLGGVVGPHHEVGRDGLCKNDQAKEVGAQPVKQHRVERQGQQHVDGAERR